MAPPIDELDLRILDLLQADGRMPFVKIAEQLGVSDTTVRTRVDRLVRRFGVKFVVDVDPNDLGLVFVYLAVGVQGPALARAVERMTALPSVVFREPGETARTSAVPLPPALALARLLRYDWSARAP